MIILALDSTTRAGSVALWRDGDIDERAGDEARSHAERLPGDLAALLDERGLSFRDVELYAVASGPGSFTGLRVGIATIQGLALVHGRKVVPVSSLDLLAHAAARQHVLPPDRLVGAWMNAYRGEVFAELYRTGDPVGGPFAGRAPLRALTTLSGPTVGPPDAVALEWQTTWSAHRPSLIVMGDAVPSARTMLEARFGEALAAFDAPALAATLADCAATWPDRAVAPHAIVPHYVRRPDAELARSRA